MKTLLIAAFLAGFSFAVLAAEKPVLNPSPTAQRAGTATVEGVPHDPFATDGTEAQPEVKVSDPLEPMNRVFFHFNDKLYFWAIKPVTTGYNKVAPQPVRMGMKRFFANVKYPIRLVNNLLQLKIQRAGIETARFVVNSSVGLGGFLDPAREELKLEAQPADFDQTLGSYGIPPGFYLNWPLLGPSSVRGTVGRAGDVATTPWTYIDSLAVNLGVSPYEVINDTSFRLGEYESFKKAAFDPYVALRSAYYDNRRSFIRERAVAGGKRGAANEALALEELAMMRRLHEQLVVMRRLGFASSGVFSGMKGAEKLMTKGPFVAPKPGPKFNLNVEFDREDGTKLVPPTKAPSLPKK